MGESCVIMYDRPKPGPKPFIANKLRLMRHPTETERKFLISYTEAPGHGIKDMREARRILSSLLSVPVRYLNSDDNLHMALKCVMASFPAPRKASSENPFVDREGGADMPELARPLKPGETQLLRHVSEAPCRLDDDIAASKALAAELLGVSAASLDTPETYDLAIARVLKSNPPPSV